MLVRDPVETGTCLDPACDWSAEGDGRDVRRQSRDHVRAANHEVLLTGHATMRMETHRQVGQPA